MRIGILSDTHDRLERTVKALDLLLAEGVQHLIHCGDYTTPEIIHVCGRLPGHYTLGNNDFDEAAIRAAIEAVQGEYLGLGGELVLEGRRIGVTHGHDARTFRGLIASMPDYLLFGHTHIGFNQRDGPTRQINPGALHRAGQYTVACLDTANDTVRFLEVEPTRSSRVRS
jgi:hypothetical protein